MTQIDKMNEYLKRLTDYTMILKERSDKDKLREFSEFRCIDMDTLEKNDVFYIGEMAEMLVPKYLSDLTSFGVISPTNRKPIFHNRWVMPIKNEYGQVINLVGYSNNSKERYVYGTALYYDRQNTLYGLENLDKAYELGYAIITEGITDTLSVRDLGFENTFAWCGTMRSTHKLKLLNRCRCGTINIHDRDKPGDKTKAYWNTFRHFTFVTPLEYKDANETLSYNGGENKEWFKQCLNMAVEWILEAEHHGMRCECRQDTMI